MSTRSCIYVFGGQEGKSPFVARLYRHMDGYPSSNLATISAAAMVAEGNPKKFAQALLLGSDGVRLDMPSNFTLQPTGGDLDVLAANIQDFCDNAPEDQDKRVPERSSCAWVAGWMQGLEENIRVKRPAEPELGGRAARGVDAREAHRPDFEFVAPSSDELEDFPIGSKLDVRVLGNQGDLEWVYFIDVDRKNVNVYGGQPSAPSMLVDKGSRDSMFQLEGLIPQYVSREREEVEHAISLVEKAGWTINQAQLGIEAECAKDARKWDELDQVSLMLPRGMSMAFPSQFEKLSRFEGVLLSVGESWVLQEVKLNNGKAYFVHGRDAFGDQPLARGRAYLVNYPDEAKQKAQAMPLIAPKRDRSATPGLFQ